MKHYYSSETKGFYIDIIHKNGIPASAVEITKDYYDSLFADQRTGKHIVPDENGYPVAIIPPKAPLTWEKIRAKRDVLLKNSDWSVVGDATPKPSKEAWLAYRLTLRELPQSFSAPDDVVWPKKPR